MDAKQRTQEVGQNLRRIADEIRVKMHLAGKDAKDAWDALEPKFHEFERRAKESTGKVADDLAKFGADLEGQMKKLVARFRS